MRLTIFGPPGSGKGTYAKMLGKDFIVPVISIGDILREEVDNKTEIGLEVKGIIEKGELVPDDIILKLVSDRAEDNLVFDGFPRTMKQISVDIDRAVNLICGDEVCIKRTTSRRLCEKCKKIYNLITMKPKKRDMCDVCKGRLVGRSDEDVVKERLRVFRRETFPVINYFKKKGSLIEIDGERSVAEVYKDIRKLFKLKE